MLSDSALAVREPGSDALVRSTVLPRAHAEATDPQLRVGVAEVVILPPVSDHDEHGWIRWARIALKYEGIQQALDVLGAYLALNPSRADELAEEWRLNHLPVLQYTVIPR